MEEVQSPTADINRPEPLPSTANWNLGENLALSHLSALPELPQYNAEDYKLQQLQYAMHLDSSMLTYTPAPGVLKNGEPQQATNRFDDSRVVKRKIFVNKEVLGRLVSVAEELNKAQAQIEIRKMLKREHRRRHSEQQQLQQQQTEQSADGNSAMMAELLAGLEVEGGVDEDAGGAGSGYNGIRRPGARMAKRAPGVYRMAQVRCPAVLTSMAPKDRWGYFRAMQRLMPAANGGRPGHIAFGSMAPQFAASGRPRAQVMGAAAVKAAKQLQMVVERQAEAALGDASITECGEDDGQSSMAAGGGGGGGGAMSGGGDALANLDATVQAAMHANQVREARRAAARQLAEEEGLPTETWWDIMQKRKKLVYFKKLLDEMTGRMDMIKLHRAARVIQKAWRAHHRTRTRNASEEIALLQKELAHRKAMEGALRAAAEAAILDQQERAKKRAARLAARVAAFNAMQEAAAQHMQQAQQPSQSGAMEGHGGRGGNNGTFSRATSSKNLGWQHSLRSSIHSSLSHSASMSASRAASARRLDLAAAAAGEGNGGDQPVYMLAQNNLWSKIQALIGTDWDVDGDEEDSDDVDDEDEDEDDEEEGEEGDSDSEDEAARRLRRRRERNEARKARKAAADAAAAAATGGDGERKKKKKKGQRIAGEGMAPMSKTTMLVKVVKQAMMAAKAMQDEDEKKGGGKRNQCKHRRGSGATADPATSMSMLAAAAAALNMSVEAYVTMRNRKMGVTALRPWQPPPVPLLIEADGKPVAIEEHELREMEEEARRELLEKAAIDFVTAATAAAGPSVSTTFSGSAPGRTGSTMSGTASVALSAALSADASSVMTWGSAAAAALAGGEGSERLLLSSLSLSENRSASEMAAAFAAAAAPSLTIPEDDVWALVKEKLRLRMAARAAEANGPATSTAASGRRASVLDSDYGDSEYSSSDYDGDTSDHDSDKTGQRRRDRRHHNTKHRSGSGAGGAAWEGRRGRRGGRGWQGAGGSSLPGRRRGGHLSDSGYETMSEGEIRTAGRATLLRIQHQKERSRKRLQGYYTDRRRAKKAAAAAAAAALHAERAAARAARRDALVPLRRGAIAGPAWRPGGGGAQPRRSRAAATADEASATEVAAMKPPPVRFWRPAPSRRPLRPLHGPGPDAEGGGASDGWSMAAPKPPPIRLGPYNLSPGGPSLLYREPRHRSREGLTSREGASVRAATWRKGAEVPGAVFTQYGWVQARSNGAGNLLTLQLQSLPEPELVPALEAYVRQLGIPQHGLGGAKNSVGSNRPHLAPGGHLPPSVPHHGRMQPLMVGGTSALDAQRAASPSGGAVRPPPAPNSVAAIFGAASAGFFVSHAPVMPHPPGHHPPSAVVRSPPAVVATSPTRGAVRRRNAVPVDAAGSSGGGSGGEVANAEDDVEGVEAMTATGATVGGSWTGPLITDKGDCSGLGVPAVVGRALGSPTSSRSLLARVRFNGEGQDRGGLPGGSGSLSRRSHTTSRRSMSPLLVVPVEEWPPGDARVLGSAMPITSRNGAGVGASGGGGSSTSFRSASRGARSASTAFTAAAAAGGFGEADSDGDFSAAAEDTFAGPRTESLRSPGQKQQDEDVATLQGEPFEVAVAVLRSKSIKPGVVERVFPQGLAHINDPTSSVAPQQHENDGGNADGDGPMSYPLEDITSSSSESGDDGDGWATASDEGGRQGEQTTPPDLNAGIATVVAKAGGGKSDSGIESLGDTAPVAASLAPISGADKPPLRQSLPGAAPSQSIPPAAAVAPPATAGEPRGRAAPRMRQVHAAAAAPSAIQASGVRAAGDVASAAAAAPPDEGPLNDEDGERQFDLLYDMTRWAVTRPSTPTDYRVEDDHIAITLRRSKEAKQRDQEEVHQVRRARLLAAYGGGAGAAVYGGNAYERVLFRRRHARALAALAASQSPLAQLLRAVAFDHQVAGKPLLQHRNDGGGGSTGGTGSFGEGGAAGATSGGGFRRPRRVGAAGGNHRRFVASSAIHGNLNCGVIWMPTRGGKVEMRVKPGGGCVSGFGNSYYWRQPVRLTSLMHIRPAAPDGQVASMAGSEGGGAEPAELTRSRSRGVSGRHPAAAPSAPPEVTEMANTALKLLSDLGSEIGRMEEEIQALQRQAEQEEGRRQGKSDGAAGPMQAASPLFATGATASHIPVAMAPIASPPPPRSPSGSMYRTQYITFHHQCHVQAQGQQQLAQQQSQQQRPASRSRMMPAPSLQRLTLMTLEPPTGIHGTPVPRLPHPQRPISPPQARVTQGRQASTNGGSGSVSPATVAAVGNRRSVIVNGGTAPPQPSGAAASRAAMTTVASRGVAEPADVTGPGDGGVASGARGSGLPPDNVHIHSVPLLHLGQPPPLSRVGLVSPKLQNVSSIVSGSGYSFGSNTAGQLGSVESALLDVVMPPGPPLTAPAALNAGGRRLTSNQVLVPTPHNTLSSNGGWPSSCLSTMSGMAPIAADAAPVSPPLPSPPVAAPVPVWAFPRRSITGAEPANAASIARVVWELPSPKPAAGGTVAVAAPVSTCAAASQSSAAPHCRVGVQPYPRQNSPPTLLPNIGTTTSAAAVSPLRPSVDGVGTRLVNQVVTLSSSSASALVAAAAAATKGSPSQRQGSAGHEVTAAPPSPPLAAWGATSSVLVGMLPEISQMSLSPRNYATMRSSVSYSASGSPAGGSPGGAGNFAISAGGRVSTPLFVASRAGPAAAASPPHSPLRNYPRMELGLGAGASPYRLRRGSSNGPGAVYYQYSVGGGGGGQQVVINEAYDNGVSVDSLLLNVALFGPGGLGGSGGGDRAAAALRASMTAAPSTRWPRASDASMTMPTPLAPPLTTTVSAVTAAPTTMEVTTGGSPRFGRVRRLSMEPLPGSGSSGGGRAAAVSP